MSTDSKSITSLDSKSDVPYTKRWIAACVIAILLVELAVYGFQRPVFIANFHNPVFWAIMVVIDILLLFASRWAINQADDYYDNLSRAAVIICTIAHIAWALSWMAGQNEKVGKGSPQLETKATITINLTA